MLFGIGPVSYTHLLCGYPMGAKLAHDLYIDQQISRREGEYLLTFSCNASPAFIISYLSGILLKNKISAVQMILTFLAADLFCMLFFRFVVYRGHTVDLSLIHISKPTRSIRPVILSPSRTSSRFSGFLYCISARCIAFSCGFFGTYTFSPVSGWIPV